MHIHAVHDRTEALHVVDGIGWYPYQITSMHSEYIWPYLKPPLPLSDKNQQVVEKLAPREMPRFPPIIATLTHIWTN